MFLNKNQKLAIVLCALWFATQSMSGNFLDGLSLGLPFGLSTQSSDAYKQLLKVDFGIGANKKIFSAKSWLIECEANLMVSRPLSMNSSALAIVPYEFFLEPKVLGHYQFLGNRAKISPYIFLATQVGLLASLREINQESHNLYSFLLMGGPGLGIKYALAKFGFSLEYGIYFGLDPFKQSMGANFSYRF